MTYIKVSRRPAQRKGNHMTTACVARHTYVYDNVCHIPDIPSCLYYRNIEVYKVCL